ncbi:BACON domain-containing protein [Streptomyces sp. NBC_00247]|uniref:BACON domain-containing protein n=1 Tax=Streptomyces sp. NBC_00247 TaxID=2975689 RepID=UPI003FA70153
MTSSRLEPPTHTTGAHRSPRRAPHLPAQRPPARDEPYLDGLFTYCLSVLCDHEAATEALGAVLAVAERQDGRCPTGQEERKSWLYALARWMCLRVLAEQKRGRQAHRRTPRDSGRPVSEERGAALAEALAPAAPAAPAAPEGAPGEAPVSGPVTGPATGVGGSVRPADRGGQEGGSAPDTAGPPRTTPEEATVPPSGESPASEARRRELAQLAWPEAAGTTPEQREALELSVRHGLTPRAVASVLGLDPATARELLAAASCEVERTRAALAVAEDGTCSAVRSLTRDRQALLSAPLRRELVRHVDDCPRCRRAAERAGAAGPWPGVAVAPAAGLPVVEAPRPSVRVAMAHAQRSRAGSPRFDRAGYPLDPKDHAARRDRLRARVMTTTVVATVVAAPVIALWAAAYRGAPAAGDRHEGASPAATEMDAVGESAGTFSESGDGDGPRGGDGHGDGSTGGGSTHAEEAGAVLRDGSPDGAPAPEVTAEVIGTAVGARRAGAVTVAVRTSGGVTSLRLTASGGGPAVWAARTDARWLRLSRSSGTLAAGESTTLHVRVDRSREPRHPWRARVVLAPGSQHVRIEGRGRTPAFTGFPAGGPLRPTTPDAPPAPTRPAAPRAPAAAAAPEVPEPPAPVSGAPTGAAPAPAGSAGPPPSPSPDPTGPPAAQGPAEPSPPGQSSSPSPDGPPDPPAAQPTGTGEPPPAG